MPGISGIAIVLLFAVTQSATEQGIAAFKEGHYSEALTKLKDARDQTGLVFLALTQAALGDCKTALPGLSSGAGARPGSVSAGGARGCEML